MITKIEAENLKGHSFLYELGPLTAITGPNFSGKTAIIEAIRLALIGHIPEIGKRTSATMELASGEPMMVCATISSLSEPILRIFQDGKQIVSGERAEFSDLPLLNSEHYFSLTDKERTQYVFERIKMDGSTKEEIVAEAQGLIFAGAGPEHEKAHQLWIGKLRALLGRGIQVGLAELVHELKDAYSINNARMKATQGATAILIELKNREAAATTSVEYCDKQIKTGAGVVDDIGTKLRAEAQAKFEHDDAVSQLKKLRTWMETAEPDWAGMIAQAEAELATIKLVGAPSVPELGSLLKIEAGLETEVKQLKHLGENYGEELKALDELEECPYCKSKSRGWKQHLKAKLKKDAEETAEQLAEKGCEFTTLHDQLAVLKREREQALEAGKAFLDAGRRRDELQNKITGYKASQDVGRKQAEHYQSEVKRLEAITATPPTGDIEQLQADLNAAREALQVWRDKLRVAVALEQDIKRAAEAQLEHQTAVAQLEVIKTFGRFVEQKRKAMIEGVFTKLCADANEICDGILPTPIAFYDGTVGRWTGDLANSGGRFIPHRVFSGVEKALCYVAIAMALSTQGKERIVLLDELGRMTQSVRHNVMIRLKEAVNKGLIGQAIVVIPTEEKISLSPWWLRIEL